ncbi:MAG: hypothetical protein Q9M11_03630 [Mariprofundaceae bacterium]|nr:hypothetical protein [Mariprofundaceae bacterium]
MTLPGCVERIIRKMVEDDDLDHYYQSERSPLSNEVAHSHAVSRGDREPWLEGLTTKLTPIAFENAIRHALKINVPMVHRLVTYRGARPTEFYDHAIRFAAEVGNLTVVKLLLSSWEGPGPDTKFWWNRLLVSVIMGGNDEVFDYLTNKYDEAWLDPGEWYNQLYCEVILKDTVAADISKALMRRYVDTNPR